jgi:hypothetical protein
MQIKLHFLKKICEFWNDDIHGTFHKKGIFEDWKGVI